LQHGKQRFDLRLVLQVQGGELDRHHQHPGGRLGADDVVGEAQRRDGGVAAHEAYQGPLDLARQVELAGKNLVDAGRDEARAARDDEVGDPVHRRLRFEGPYRPQRQAGRGLGIDLHPSRGRRKRAVVEAAGLDRRAAVRRRRQHGPAVADAGAGGHAREQAAQARVGDAALGPGDERLVHVMIRHRGPDGVDVGGGRKRLRGCRSRLAAV
jgi:hypothetical protein